MKLTKDELKRRVGVKSNSTLNAYLERQEFKHIKKFKMMNKLYYFNVSDMDIKILKMLVRRRKLSEKDKEILYEELQKLGEEQWQASLLIY